MESFGGDITMPNTPYCLSPPLATSTTRAIETTLKLVTVSCRALHDCTSQMTDLLVDQGEWGTMERGFGAVHPN